MQINVIWSFFLYLFDPPCSTDIICSVNEIKKKNYHELLQAHSQDFVWGGGGGGGGGCAYERLQYLIPST